MGQFTSTMQFYNSATSTSLPPIGFRYLPNIYFGKPKRKCICQQKHLIVCSTTCLQQAPKYNKQFPLSTTSTSIQVGFSSIYNKNLNTSRFSSIYNKHLNTNRFFIHLQQEPQYNKVFHPSTTSTSKQVGFSSIYNKRSIQVGFSSIYNKTFNTSRFFIHIQQAPQYK